MIVLLVVAALATLGFFYCAARIVHGMWRSEFRPVPQEGDEPEPWELDEREIAERRFEERRRSIDLGLATAREEIA